ncbi:MAG TPA: hypothetical protein VIR01_19575, partial [Pyrinomonadaceae bacterium]
MAQLDNNLCVMKFGGTSVQDAGCIKRAAEIIASKTSPVVTIVSAMGGVTNRLIAAAHQSATGDEAAGQKLKEELLQQHVSAIQELVDDDNTRQQLSQEIAVVIDRVADLCRGTSLLNELTPRALDDISSAGERLSARLVAAAVRRLGVDSVAVDATDLIVTDAQHGQAEPLMEK